jgi:hypothetical protein
MSTGGSTLLERPKRTTGPAKPAPTSARRPTGRPKRYWLGAALLALAAVVAVVLGLVGHGSVTVAGPSDGPMGLTTAAWREYRSGERAGSQTVVDHGPDWIDYRSGERATAVSGIGGGSDGGTTTVITFGPDWQEYRAGER